MQCPRCLNTDRKYFYKGSRGWYCRRCISFGRAMIEEEKEVRLQEIQDSAEEYVLKYPLTEAQKRISDACAETVMHSDVLLHCVCGAGKTELVTGAVSKMMKMKKKVCFAISRRQVVIEIAERLRQYFPNASVIQVCGGYTKILDGDLIVCTTHQLYRYRNAFDLLILDEPDAFPFRSDPVLHGIARTSCRGHLVYLTATPDAHLKQRVTDSDLVCYELNRRPHGHDLPVPVIRCGPLLYRFAVLASWLKQEREHPRMIFVPTIRTAKILYRFLKIFMKCSMCTSKTENRDEVIRDFRSQKAGIIVCTTVLERGVTVENVSVAVYNADHRIFDEAGLIQMAGRAGRSFRYPDGSVLFLTSEKSRLAESCRKQIEQANLCTV